MHTIRISAESALNVFRGTLRISCRWHPLGVLDQFYCRVPLQVFLPVLVWFASRALKALKIGFCCAQASSLHSAEHPIVWI